MQDVETLSQQIRDFYIKKSIDKLNITNNAAFASIKPKIDAMCDKFNEYFIKLAKVCIVSNIDYGDYIQYVFAKSPAKFKVWPKRLCSIDLIKKYAEEKDIENQYAKILQYFKKTYDFILNNANELELSMTDYFKHIIINKKLIGYIMSGNISSYWLSTLGKNNLIKILNSISDPSSKITFSKIVEKCDVYFSAVSAAYYKKYGKKINPFRYESEV